MTKEYVTGIWLAKFDNAAALRKYVEHDYSENEDSPICRFADDIGLPRIDTDFLESTFVDAASEILNNIINMSFVKNFRNDLLTDINSIDYADKNSIISVSGIRDDGELNTKLFDWTPTQDNKENLQFV